MTKTNALVTLAFSVSLALGCGGGGPGDPTDTHTSTNTGVCVAATSGAATDCTSITTDTNTGTDTTTTTVTKTDTSTTSTTDTNTVVTVTIPDWFKVNTYYYLSMINQAGGSYAEVKVLVTKINGDGTWTATVNNCIGSCAGIGGEWAGNISTTSFTVNNITASGVIPSAVSGPNNHSSGIWNYNQSNGTFII